MRQAIAGLMLAMTMTAAIVATPGAAGLQSTPEAMGTPVVDDVSEIQEAYDAAREQGLAQGRTVVETLLSDDPGSLFDRLSPQLQGMVGEAGLDDLIAGLEQSRARFALAEPATQFDGHLSGDTIEGYVYAGSLLGFSLQREGAAAGDHPLAGNWSGAMAAGQESIAISVEIVSRDGQLEGTISIPDFQIDAAPLDDVSYLEEAPIGIAIDDQALPRSPGMTMYWARHAWGDAQLGFQLGFDDAGTITTLQIAPEPQLPLDPMAGHESDTAFRLPFDGVWWVFWGGETALENYHVVAPNQRHALDMMIWNEGSTFSGDGTHNEDYWAWGQSVLAPAAGTIVAVLDGIADNQPGVTNTGEHPAGNHVVLQTGDEEFVFLAHLQQGSIQVQEGDEVAAGDLLGLAGNSGNSSEPHLHMHAQNRLDFFAADAVGLPLVFSDIVVDGEARSASAVGQGQLIGNA
jgi:hypothetical protein